MARKKKGPEPPEEGFEDFVPAVMARSAHEAEEYRDLLNDHDIPAIVGDEEGLWDPARPLPRRLGLAGVSRGLPVLVPEVLLDEASVVISERDFDLFPGEEDVEEEEEDEMDELGPVSEGESAAEEEARRPARPPGPAAPFGKGEDLAAEEDEEEDDLLLDEEPEEPGPEEDEEDGC